jgi:putative protease
MENPIGVVTHYYTHLGVAVVQLDAELKIGDTLLFLGHTTDFSQIACSMEIEHQKIIHAAAGSEVAIQVNEPVRAGDHVFLARQGQESPENRALWKVCEEARHAITKTYDGLLDAFSGETGLDARTSGLLWAALTFEPHTTTPERLRVRGPYTAAVSYMSRLQNAAEKGFLVQPEPGEFRLSERGRLAAEHLIAVSRDAMARADPLSPQDGRRLADLLTRLVQACLFNPPPPDTWSIRLAYSLMPPEEPCLPFSEQALSCLAAYRDDAHLAAWRPSGISAPALEALTLLWRGQASSLPGIYERLAGRGFEMHDYQNYVRELIQAGYASGSEDDLQISEAGRVYRDQVEQETDRLFFTPWSWLDLHEKAELSCLLARLRDEIL